MILAIGTTPTNSTIGLSLPTIRSLVFDTIASLPVTLNIIRTSAQAAREICPANQSKIPTRRTHDPRLIESNSHNRSHDNAVLENAYRNFPPVL